MRPNEARDDCHATNIGMPWSYLQPISGKSLSHGSAITEDGARLYVGFWGGWFEKGKIVVFVDARIFNHHGAHFSVYHRHEQEKRR